MNPRLYGEGLAKTCASAIKQRKRTLRPGETMPCILALVAIAFPRLVLGLLFFFSDYLEQAYRSALWPMLGFLFMPFTTLAYAWAIHANGSVVGFYLAVVVIAVLMDLGIIGGGASRRRKKAES